MEERVTRFETRASKTIKDSVVNMKSGMRGSIIFRHRGPDFL